MTQQATVGTTSVKLLLEAGAHFGHQVDRWNRKMKKYIFIERNGIHIIHLEQTMALLEKACRFVTEVVDSGGDIVFVGTKKQAQEAVEQEAKRCGMPYVNQRWQTGKPLLVSGGSVRETSPEARQTRSILVEEFRFPVRWLEERSADTYTNAVESYRILAPLGITRIHLVTHAWHVPRARLAFEHAGFSVAAAPTGFSRFDPADLAGVDFLPRASALVASYYFLHEVLG